MSILTGSAGPLHTASASAAVEGDDRWSLPTVLHWILRVAMLWCFVGHGAFGLIGKEGWLAYYRVFGVPDWLAWDSMPVIGLMDIAIGIVTLVRPMRAVLVYAIGWTGMTALLRPLAGQGLWQEVLERGGNYGIPIALLILVGLGDRSLRSWFEHARPRKDSPELRQSLVWALRICIAALLIGHGGFGITHLHDKEWAGYLDVLGISLGGAVAPSTIVMIGLFEVALGIAVLLRPWKELLAFVLVWKLGTELLRPLAGENFFEFVERGGDYFLPAALILLVWTRQREALPYLATGRVPAPAPTTLQPFTRQTQWTAAAAAPAPARTPGAATVAAVDDASASAGDEGLRKAADALRARVVAQRRQLAASGGVPRS